MLGTSDNGRWAVHPTNPATKRITLKIVRFLVTIEFQNRTKQSFACMYDRNKAEITFSPIGWVMNEKMVILWLPDK